MARASKPPPPVCLYRASLSACGLNQNRPTPGAICKEGGNPKKCWKCYYRVLWRSASPPKIHVARSISNCAVERFSFVFTTDFFVWQPTVELLPIKTIQAPPQDLHWKISAAIFRIHSRTKYKGISPFLGVYPFIPVWRRGFGNASHYWATKP